MVDLGMSESVTQTIMEYFDWSSTGITLEALMRSYSLVPAKSRRRFVADGNLPGERIVMVPPAIQPILPGCRSAKEYLETLPLGLSSHLVLLVRSGYGSMGIGTVNGLDEVKVIRRYTVRKGQGKSQDTFESKKKSRSGGAQLRRKESIRFFQMIGEELRARSESLALCKRLFIATPVRLWPEIFNARPGPPFVRDDKRLIKLALDIKTPDRENLEHFNEQLGRGYWAIESPVSRDS